jgi:hypothetical protein
VIDAPKMVKNSRWAVAVVRGLRRHDDRYTLALLRGKLQEPNAPAQAYAGALREDLAELAPTGAVEVPPHRGRARRAAGDRRRHQLVGAREFPHGPGRGGRERRALPVVRDWPFFPGAPARLFPPDWVVATPEEAARRILGLTDTEERWREVTDQAAAHVLDRCDWPAVSGDYERVLVPR